MDFSKLAFMFSAALLVFAYGVAVGRYQTFPYSVIKFGQDSVELVFEERETIAQIKPTRHLFKSKEDGNGAVRIDEDQMSPGLTFIAAFFDQDLEMRLIRPDGSIVNRWPVRFNNIFPDPSHIKPKERIPQTDWNAETHGAIALPDGSVLFNFEFNGLVRIGRCGDIQWSLPRMTHHSMDLSHDGSFWVPGLRYIESASRFPTLEPPYREDVLLKVSPDGKVLMEISMLELLFENNLQAQLFANGPEGIKQSSSDPTHLNDVEELSPEMAQHFKQFAAGDLLLSWRNLNMILVVDPVAKKIKWHRTGPWMDQHDPDFMTNGKISVFSNNNDRTARGSKVGGSTIIEADPVSGETRVRYGGVPHQRMYTQYKGKHQNLENGNTLIVESRGGRVIEVNSAGNIVWKFVNRYDDNDVALVNEATRYAPGYFKVSDWACGK